MKKQSRFWVYTALALFLVSGTASAEPLLVSAAASLEDALKEVAIAYKQIEPDRDITYNFGASGTLQRQIENGAPVDVFMSAAKAPMDALEQQQLLLPNTRRDLLTNTLVLISPQDRRDLAGFGDLMNAQVKHIAIGDPRTVPAGTYAVGTLSAHKLLPQLEPKLVRFLNVRQVLAAVETGNADAGFVYRTDAARSIKVRIVVTAEKDSHEPIVYPAAVVRATKQPDEAKRYLRFLESDTAKSIFEKHGFQCAK